jgi:hypothetical protein
VAGEAATVLTGMLQLLCFSFLSLIFSAGLMSAFFSFRTQA